MNSLHPSIAGHFLSGISLAPFTSFKIGGPARFFFEPSTIDEIAESVDWARNYVHLPYFIIGKGSNLVVSDKGIEGLVIRIGERFSGVRREGNRVRAKAGSNLMDLIEKCIQKGMKGCEYLSGIPGTIGGALYMNAGAFEQTISDCLISATFLSEKGVRVLGRHELDFGYRKSRFMNTGNVILEAEFEFGNDSPDYLLQESHRILQRRREKQPWDMPSAGSIFRRPPTGYAGQLIEQAGLKGKTIGGAMVSEKHAGFIVNTGKATALDVYFLIKEIQRIVFEKFHVNLETEAIFLGDFNT